MRVSIIQLSVIFLSLFFSRLQASEDLDPNEFQTAVLDDDRVWLVEFYSPMCGSCQEFAPTWDQISTTMKSIATAKINIDVKEGMEIANRLGVLEEGLPNIRLFSGKINGVSILAGQFPYRFLPQLLEYVYVASEQNIFPSIYKVKIPRARKNFWERFAKALQDFLDGMMDFI